MTRTRQRNARREKERAEKPPAPPAPSRLREPRDGLPPVIDRIQPLLAWCEAAASNPEEPVAVDAERASSFRYSSRAYLLQLRTDTAGTALVDPVAFTLPPQLAKVLRGREWVLHAAGQDLPCLAELGLAPDALFDTELAARLLGMERVGLGAVVEDTLGLSLAKEHSAADWSSRPLPESWLVYAALDVEVLVEVRDVLAARLESSGKTSYAREEFEYARTAEPAPARSSSWRGLHSVGVLRSPRQMAAARAMWERRDAIAREEDLSPHRVLRDRDLVSAAKAAPQGKDDFLAALPRTTHHKDQWWKAARSGLTLPPSHLPEREPSGAMPSHKQWAKKFPELSARYQAVREAVGQRAEDLEMPTENLLQPSLLRQWAWDQQEVQGPTEQQIAEQLAALGARSWQVEQTAAVIQRALQEQAGAQQ